MTLERSEGALLAGVCAGIARTFGWNVWALRALFFVFLLFKTLWAVAAYAVLALVMHLAGGGRFEGWTKRTARDGDGGLDSPELAARNRRIAELERRFRDLEGRGM